jgi:hypothetical protein
MGKVIGELLFEIMASIVRGLVYSLWLKTMTWMSTRIHNPFLAVAVAFIMGVGLFFLMPIVTGALLALF